MHNKGGTERAGGNCAARRGQKQGRGVIALKKQTDKQINVHLKAQEWGHRKEVGVRAKGERHDDRPQNERNQTERA